MSRIDHTDTNPDETQANIMSPITQALTKSKITLEETCKRLKESMDAKETKVFNDSGKLIYSDALIAHGIRLKAVVEALKLQQAYPAEKHEIKSEGVLVVEVIKFGESSGSRLPETNKER